jgi:beta-xylosidase
VPRVHRARTTGFVATFVAVVTALVMLFPGSASGVKPTNPGRKPPKTTTTTTTQPPTTTTSTSTTTTTTSTTSTTTTTTIAPPAPGPAPTGASANAVIVGMPDGFRAIDFPDPFVFRASGGANWYAYATGAGFVDLQMILSPDLVNWFWVGDPLPGGANNWADLFANTWAPSVIQRGNTFVMYYTAHSRALGRPCIGRATSSSPEGPFYDTNNGPLICQSQGSLDPSPYVAADGSLWLTYSNVGATIPTSIWSVRLSSDGLSLAGTPANLLTTAPGWESNSYHPLIEAPTMISSPSGIELFYSANPYDTSTYAVGVARCDTPSGPCTRIYTTPVLATRSTMAGPGGQTPFQDGSGNWQVAFHSWTSPNVGYPSGGKRTLRFLPMTFPGGLPKIG